MWPVVSVAPRQNFCGIDNENADIYITFLTMSPGLTETATTVPGMGDLKMLEVSSAAFSGMYLLSSAATFVSICNLY